MARAKKPRWWLLAAILIVAAMAEIVVWNRNSGDALEQVLATWMVAFSTLAAVLLWWLFLSRVSWKMRFAGLAGLALAVALFFGLFRFQGATGDFIPRFAFRFSKSAEDLAVEYFESRAAAKSSSAAVAGERLDVTAADWPGFRGPNRDGRAPGEVVRTDWEENPPVAVWRHEVGPGWSSFAVAGGLLFTQEQRGEDEVVVAYRAETGEEVWAHANRARHETFLGGTGPRATPTLYDSRLYALGATGILDCLDPLSGELIWSRDIAADAGTEQLDFGFAGSPLVFDDLVVVNPGKNVPSEGDPEMYAGTPPGALVAYHRVTGEGVWKTVQRQAGYAAPRLEAIDGDRQILLYSAHGLGGHDPATGEELWWFEWINPYGTNSIQPIATGDGGVFISTEATGSALVEPRKSGVTPQGDERTNVTPEEGQRNRWTVTPRWERPNLFKLRFNGGVLDDAHVYGLDGGILAALDLSTGERVWKRGRYKYGQLLMLRDHLLVQAESGDVAVVEVSPEGMKEVARFHAIDGRSWNHPVVNRGFLYVRSDEEAACYDLRPNQADP